jgi:predicted membrane-bound spermidine synthase
MKSWKTTSTGILAIAGAIVTLWFKRHELNEAVIMAAITAIVSGVGLISARDNGVSSEDAGAK